LFTALLDFGSTPFESGAARWLQLGVRTAPGAFTDLSPMQLLTATPYAITAGSVTSVNAGSLASGTVPISRLSGITSNQLDAATWQFLVSLASGVPSGMVLIPSGSFVMGDTLGGMANAVPVPVNVSAFYMDANLVTWGQWQGVYAYATNHGYAIRPGAGKAGDHPVQMVNWYDAVKWCNARSQQAGKTPAYYSDAALTQVYTTGEVAPYVNWTAKGYRLPTESEWEKAARGGLAGQKFPWGDTISESKANYLSVAGLYLYDLGPAGSNPIGLVGGSPYTSPAGSFAANGYGLYDMAGNVTQWCWDLYGTPYAGGTDPRGPASGTYRVLRGGGWDYYAYDCRVAIHDYGTPANSYNNRGFRSVLSAGQ
jgi:formylglycine-generating enzyme required for sulfatase activity